MAITGDYPHPVTVNGFACHNCAEVDEAKKHIDPAHPKDGPYGINAKPRAHGPAVILSGRLADLAQPTSPARPSPDRSASTPTAQRLDLTV